VSTKKRTFVIVGAGLAGAKAAETLRDEGYDERIVVIGDERELPYERPPLTKNYLRGEVPRARTYVRLPPFYSNHEIELWTGTAVTSVDTNRSRVILANGSELRYDRLLLATGAEPRRLTVPGASLDGVHYLRTLSDCDQLRRRLAAGGKVVVVGAGWIGAEFAASARQAGLDVTVIEPAPLPFQRILGDRIGALYRDVHRDHGVEMLLGTGVEAIEGSGAVERVTTTDGRAIDCDFVVVGIGVVPRVELAERAGLYIDNGIVVDQRMATTNADVFAAGDVASAWHPFYEQHIRVEHWANALNQGPAAARAMLGDDGSYERIPYFYSDQYEVGMEYLGYAPEWDELVVRGSRATREFIAFWLRDERVVAGMNVNVWDVTVEPLIRSRQRVDAARLADPDTPLDSLVAEGRSAHVR
jgi:3-phenylpropionate/trans-cinnamate dioxygenase ferredoxin reductase subunit